MEWRPSGRGAACAHARRRHCGASCRARQRTGSQQARGRLRMSSVQQVYPDGQVTLREVGLRDGLQLSKTFPSTAIKQRWLREEYAAGVRCFEVGSFLPAKTFPQFADVREIVATVTALPGA